MIKGIPLQVWRLMLASALMMAGTSLMVLIAGIIGTRVAPSPAFATLPVALTIVGVACSTLPTGKLLYLFGRQRVFLAYGLLSILAALLAAWSLSKGSFWLFCMAAMMIGWSAAAGHQYRFAAMESVPVELAPKATSVLLFGGILAAAIGPEMALKGQFLFKTEFVGSFLLLAAVYLLGTCVIAFYRDTRVVEQYSSGSGRPLKEIMRSPVILLAVSASAVAYAVMSFVMTASPISMHEHAGHPMQATKWVLQSHILAMYLPSLVYPWLYSKLGYKGLLWAGTVAYVVCLGIGLINTQLLHFWLTMVILGVGWNFLFLSGTNMLRYGYRPEERFKVQSFNDFLVFSVQAAASLSSGWFLFYWGWQGVLSASVPLVLVFAVLAFALRSLKWQEPR